MSRRKRDLGPADLITIAAAAALLGVSLPTMRRWDELGKFRARRHPLNAYRLYAYDDVMRLRKKIVDGERARLSAALETCQRELPRKAHLATRTTGGETTRDQSSATAEKCRPI